MKQNLGGFDRALRTLFGVFLLFAAAILFQHPLARVLVGLFGVYFVAYEGLMGRCSLYYSLGICSPRDRLSKENIFLLGVFGVQAVLAYEWWSAGWHKVSSGEFVDGIENTLAFFASKNPFPWYADFLNGFAMENATAFAYTVEIGQVLIALGLFGTMALFLASKDAATKRQSIMIMAAALLGGALMNANFYLAAGWTGPGTHGSNLVMFWSQIVLFVVWIYYLLQTKKGRLFKR